MLYIKLQIVAAMALAALAGACGGNAEPAEAPAGAAGVIRDKGTPPVSISIVFGGDVMQHLPQIESARRDSTYDYAETFRHIAPFLDSADLAIVNLETTLSDRGRYTGYPLFSAPAELAFALRSAGADAVTLANNHILDKGRDGILSTIRVLDSAGVRHTGAFADSTQYRAANPLVFNAKGIRVALLSYTYGVNGMPVTGGTIVNRIDTVRIAADLARAREQADHTIVCFHWGYEYHSQPNAAQHRLAAWCHDRGADFVIGGHPHVLQPLKAETDNDPRVLFAASRATGSRGKPLPASANAPGLRRITAYSLGNLVSNQRKRYRDGGMLLRLDITLRDKLPPSVRASYMLTWVYTPYENGRRQYIILPSPVADTMLLDAASKAAYDMFVADSRALLGDSPFREIRYRNPRLDSFRDFDDYFYPVSYRPATE